ncbi:MAG: hypothetical protein DLM65_01200 [Candidatus Aeolococcus gillhamiae]|uniref:Formate transporter n=2 Tax=Candidatus Aeolococcus gillhamiae TaxID=3127015 RepID=A0A2W5ZEC4_9BACT|nr:MAG: hypothetical protein DLM65_01200 [Candidatus Dormibacter sp. RRmetagenome_bin12]
MRPTVKPMGSGWLASAAICPASASVDGRPQSDPMARTANRPKAGEDDSLPVDEVLGEEPDDVIERGSAVGEARLGRSTADILITAIIGGVEVSLGGLAAAVVIGALLGAAPRAGLYAALVLAGVVFPIGFVFVILGRSELFTENFLIPVVAVVKGDGRAVDLLRLWAVSWVGNMFGCVAMAAMLSVPEAIGAPIIAGYTAYADYKLNLPLLAVFVSAVLAGLIMTVLTWLVLAVRNVLGKILVIWAAGFVVFAANTSHTVVGAALIFVGFQHTSHSWLEVAAWMGITTAGNLVGGVGLVTIFRLAQTSEKARTSRAP